ncbi:MAG TPA: DUF2892 domain-containing protein [Gaiellaceae bacterium]|nr:DUF2892 domain-containing protein [Gaiellaceae bacterium]
MSPNMSCLDRRIRFVVGLVAVALAIVLGAGTIAGIVLLVVAAVMVATSVTRFCPLYRLIRFDSRGHRPLAH